jgi:hypothetical protein
VSGAKCAEDILRVTDYVARPVVPNKQVAISSVRLRLHGLGQRERLLANLDGVDTVPVAVKIAYVIRVRDTRGVPRTTIDRS